LRRQSQPFTGIDRRRARRAHLYRVAARRWTLRQAVYCGERVRYLSRVSAVRDWLFTIPFLLTFGLSLLVFDPAQRIARLFGRRPGYVGAR
jgi:hypothetical protein